MQAGVQVWRGLAQLAKEALGSSRGAASRAGARWRRGASGSARAVLTTQKRQAVVGVKLDDLL